MNLKKALNRRTVSLHLQGATKQEIIEEMVGLLDKAGLLRNRDAALACVLEREQQMSTGMQYGVAIPHGRTDTTDTLLAAVGIHPHGVDFDSIDHEPSRLFILTVSPRQPLRPSTPVPRRSQPPPHQRRRPRPPPRGHLRRRGHHPPHRLIPH
jgi:mannitol/fructose-specific phosphotransferase system IIA component (Ntr-type)